MRGEQEGWLGDLSEETIRHVNTVSLVCPNLKKKESQWGGALSNTWSRGPSSFWHHSLV